MSAAKPGPVARAGVIGWPVDHSLSPVMHRYWLSVHGIDGRYDRIPVSPDALPAAFDRVRRGELRGFNVTLPHKLAAPGLVDIVSDRACRAGSVNTVVRRSDGRLEGDSTDGYGFLESVREIRPDFRPEARPVCLLGAGGAARSIAAVLLDAGCPEVRIVNRSPDRAAALRDHLGDGIRLYDLAGAGRAAGDCGLLVNTTSLGMKGQPPMDPALQGALLAPADDTVLVADIVYTPLATALLQAAAARGLATVDGLGMLLHQGRPGFAAWFGVAPAVSPALRQAMLDHLQGG